MMKKLKYKRILASILLLVTMLSVAQPIFAASGTGEWVGGQYASYIKTTDNADTEYGIIIRKLINYNTGEKRTVFCAEHGVDFKTDVVYNGSYYTPVKADVRKACKIAYLGWYRDKGDYVVDGGISNADKKKYALVQQYIWEILGQSNARFIDSGIQAEYEAFKSEINREIAKIETRPSFDGTTGNVYGEKIDTVEATVTGNFAKFMEWADRYRQMEVRTNADTPKDAKQAYEFGAQGIGLCRTEHMFFAPERIAAIREMIVSKTKEQREKALNKILPMQRGDFEGLFREMKGLPVTIRLLDPPLHEFLPHTDEEIEALAKDMNMTFEELKNIVTGLHEFNPMMGHRGCRLDVTYPEIGVMQTKAIIGAAINVKKEGIDVKPEIMIPLIGDYKELVYVKNIVTKTADEMIEQEKIDLKYMVGTMIEIPRAALIADKIAEEAEFFSFGTNDLTQMTFGFSRDDAGKFLGEYYSKNIYDFDPFARVDEEGVGQLVEMASKLGRQTRPDIELGICGEHGGNPASVEYCHRIGLTYVSCSPYRVPIARLAAAQAAIKNPR